VKHWKVIKIVSAGLIFLAVLSKLNYSDLANLSLDVIRAILLVQPLVMITLTVLAVRLSILAENSFRNLFVFVKAVILAVGLNFFLPARMSELFKPVYLNRKVDAGLSRLIASTFIDRTIDILLLTVVSLIAFIYVFAFNIYSIVISVSLLIAGILLVTRYDELLARLLTRYLSPKLGAFFHIFVTRMKESLRLTIFLEAVGVGAIAWFLGFLLVFLFLYIAGSVPVNSQDAFMVYVFVILGAAIPALPGGIGTFEGAAVLALSRIGFDFQEALVLAIGLHIAQVLLGLIGALVILSTEKIGISGVVSQIRQTRSVGGLHEEN
jgi:uncharacterized membrane protein YbhN (UPF0104 family)